MPLYRYSGKTLDGALRTGTLQASSRENAAALLRRQSVYPIEIRSEDLPGLPLKKRLAERVKASDLSVFCRQFHAMLDGGIPLVGALDLLRRQSGNKSLQAASMEVFEEVQKGSLLSFSMKKHPKVFPEILVNMTETGEMSGQLDVIMRRMAVHFEKETRLQRKIHNAMLYPLIVAFVAVCVVWFLVAYVLPGFVDMFSGFGVALPLPTRMLLATSSFFNHFWYLLLVVPFAIIYVMHSWGRTPGGRLRMDKFKLDVPVFGKINRKVATSRFSRTLSTLLASGINIMEAMDIVHKVIGNAYISKGIQRSMDSIRKGGGITEPLRDLDVFPLVLISMIQVGEESGALDEMLSKTADFYDEEVDSAIEKMTTLIEPAIIVALAVIVGAIILSVVLPMFDMFQYAGQ